MHEGPGAVTRLTLDDWLATGYLAVAVTAVAFVLWYSGVSRLGPGRAGLLTGVAPVAAAVTGVLLGGAAPRPQVWAGIAVVVAGQVIGLRWASRAEPAPSPQPAAPSPEAPSPSPSPEPSAPRPPPMASDHPTPLTSPASRRSAGPPARRRPEETLW
ncbi:MAG TPA: DMT family transporter [Streptosporangiaceae bacterium]|nr:DMT family transporter [Streptosporangiaceae bacterium]